MKERTLGFQADIDCAVYRTSVQQRLVKWNFQVKVNWTWHKTESWRLWHSCL